MEFCQKGINSNMYCFMKYRIKIIFKNKILMLFHERKTLPNDYISNLLLNAVFINRDSFENFDKIVKVQIKHFTTFILLYNAKSFICIFFA